MRKPYPWRDRNGNFKSKEEINMISSSWDQKTWEEYLSCIEHGQKEVLLDDFSIAENIPAKDFVTRLISRAKYEEDQDQRDFLIHKLNKALNMLPYREQYIVRNIFWNGQTQVEIAKDLCIRRESVSRLFNKALRDIKNRMTF